MAHVMVTGGAGFIGSHIVDTLLECGHVLSVLDDLSSGSLENLSKKAAFHKLDIRSGEARMLLTKEPPDILIHTAAQMSVRNSMEDPVFDAEVNVVGLVNLLHAFRGKTLPYVVFLSTGGAIYGEQKSFPASEDHQIEPESVYGLAKRVGEMYLDFWRRHYGLRHAVLRLGNVYGPRQNPHGEAGVVAIFARMLSEGKTPTIYGTGDQTRDFIYVEDVARAVKLACEKAVSGTFNIGTARETSVNEIYKEIAKALNSSTKAAYGPRKEGEQLRSCIDPSRALKAFGWKAETSFSEGMARTAKWFEARVRAK